MDDFIEEEEEDLYSDLPNFKYDETVDKLQASNKELQSRVVFLEEVLEKQTKELDGFRSQCETLTKNISSLLKTAQNEIKRKDNKINELNKTLLELKTEVLTLKKRKYDDRRTNQEEEPATKQQKLDNFFSVKSTVSQFFCNPKAIEKSSDVEESVQSKRDILEKPQAPDIKIHTVYSKRMYNKIYNIGNSDSDLKNQAVESKNNGTSLENEVEVNINCKFGEKNESLSKEKSSKERVGNEQLDQPNFNLKEKETIVDSPKTSNNIVSIKNSNPLFNLFRNKNLITDNKKGSLEASSSDVGRKQAVIISGSKCIELSKEVSTLNSGTSPRREKSSDHSQEEIITNNKFVQENRSSLNSNMNRSSNFSKTENVSKDVCVKNYTLDSKISSIVNHNKVSSSEGLKISERTDVPLNKINDKCNEKLISNTKEHLNSQFSKSYCLKKSKKSIKSVICPISGGWAKKPEAVSHGNVIEMDVSKKGSPNRVTGKEELDLMDHLFGSPLKWTENSFDDTKQAEKLSPPATAFEDSCSAHIENIKFKETRNNITEVSETKITELSLTKKFSFTERKCYFQPSSQDLDNELPKFDIGKKSDISLSKDVLKQSGITHWPFKKTNNEIPSKNRQVTSPTFATFVNTESTSEACDVPSSLKSNPNTLDVNPTMKFLRSPKYNDSVLGQFDDTTQLINALAKDPSKLSPIHTPKKETKLDDTNTKTQSQQVENSMAKPLDISVNKNEVVPLNTEEKKSTQIETIPLVEKKKSVPVTKTIKKPPKNNVDKKMSDTKPLISTAEKKLSIPASVISSVEKKLSFPFSVLSPVDKKIEKKTILLEQPINILCPRKTPRQVSSGRQNIFSKKQNTAKDTKNNKVNQDQVDSIKSPSPLIENHSKTESRFIQEITALGSNKNLEDNVSDLKSHNVNNKISNKLESNRNSKSPSNNKRPSSKNIISSSVSEERKSNSVKTSSKKDRSPIKDKIKHSVSRKENVPHKRDHKSPSKKENSPLKFKREPWQIRRDLKQEIFKRPLSRRESFKRPNCYFRQSSVERKIAKDLRHYSKNRSFISSVKTVNHYESNRSDSFKVNKSPFNSKTVESKERHSPSYPTKAPLISRSSRISWSSSTSLVVSTNPSKVQSQSELSAAPPSEMKWVLRPIDFGQNPSNNPLKESSMKSSISDTTMNLSVSSSKSEVETPIKKFLHTNDSSIMSPEKSSPGKSIVIVAERRPIKFGSNN